ncbi:MAG: tRNA uridine-5-carboxymethylaminomethyl(34) synthesis GTPase MnmE [Lewinellaceae bacterium]|nr:tRNA uridine-5-carboxymethylaminomethyl(34) synthesis GTPase MnmE [Lewinellaceae bacterium]
MLASHDLTDTIVALATPPGVGALGVIRLSGKDALLIGERLFKGKPLTKVPTHTVHFGTIRTPEGTILDEVLATVFVGPRSYTGENTVEFSCHGSPYIIDELIRMFIREGARMAQPGEFTLRAFLNGRLDLSQAEAVADLIASSSAASHQVAIQQLRGGISHEIAGLRQQLIDFASLIELELDFSEEDVEFADRTQLRELVNHIRSLLAKLLESFQLGNAIKLGVTTVIAGRPNAGKSTLLNALLNEDRAIVSEIAGTTRDTIEEVLNINGIQFRIIDTAGIREATDTIEAIGVAKTLEKVRQSAVLVYLFDVVRTSPEEVRADLAQLIQPGMKVLVVANKMDLNPYTTYEHYFGSSSTPSPSSRGGELSGELLPLRAVIGAEERIGGMEFSDEEYEPGKWFTADKQVYGFLKEKARELRKNPTLAEEALWAHIRKRKLAGFEFRRQHIIGYFIPDFVCLEKKLIIEIDGGYHQHPEVSLRNIEREQILTTQGYQVLRFSNEEVIQNLDDVLSKIHLQLTSPEADVQKKSFSPSSGGGGQWVEPDAWVPIVAKEGMNIPFLKEKLYEAVIQGDIALDGAVVSNARHYEALRKAEESLGDVLRGLDTGVTSDFVAMDIRRALAFLGEITGEISTDDLLGNIFSRFCIGK